MCAVDRGCRQSGELHVHAQRLRDVIEDHDRRPRPGGRIRRVLVGAAQRCREIKTAACSAALQSSAAANISGRARRFIVGLLHEGHAQRSNPSWNKTASDLLRAVAKKAFYTKSVTQAMNVLVPIFNMLRTARSRGCKSVSTRPASTIEGALASRLRVAAPLVRRHARRSAGFHQIRSAVLEESAAPRRIAPPCRRRRRSALRA